MANSFGDPIYLDDFTAAIETNPAQTRNFGPPLKVTSIEWVKPTTTTHTCTIKDQNDIPIFDEQCTTANQSVIKYFHGRVFENLKIAVAAGNHMASGKIVIHRS